MMPDCSGHGGVLTIRNSKLGGTLLDDPRERSIMRMTHERTEVVNDVMVKAPHQPTDKRVFGCIVGGGREDVIHAVVKLRTV